MKIIFENEDEKEQIIKSLASSETCPEALFLYNVDCTGSDENDCEKCWRKALKSVSNVQ